MKIKAEQLKQQLKQPIAGGYWLSGDTPLLVLEAQDLIRRTAAAQGFTNREVFHTDKTFVANDFLQATQERSLFGDQTLIELRITGKVTEPVRNLLLEVLEQPSMDHALLITSGRIDATSQKTKWFTQLEKHLVFVPFWPVTREQLPQWLRQRASSINIQVAPDAIEYLADRVDGNLLAARQELEKLALIYPDITITLDHVTGAISDSGRWDINDLSTAVMQGKAKRTMRIFNGLRSEGVEPTLLLWRLTTDLRQLATIKHQLERGLPAAQVYRSQQVWDSKKGAVEAALRRIPLSALHRLLLRASHIDRMIKGQESGDIWAEFQALIWSLVHQGELF